jgi:hypothetical protein
MQPTGATADRSSLAGELLNCPSWRLRPRGIFLHVLSLAYAATTDPTWVPGFRDDDNEDEAILAAASGVAF